MCTQDVIIHHCPCFGVAGELHPCRALQSRPQGICLHISHRKLNLPQKCSECIKKAISVRRGSKWPYTRCRQRKGPRSAVPDSSANNIIMKEEIFSKEATKEPHGDIAPASATGTGTRAQEQARTLRHSESLVQIAPRSRSGADQHRERTAGVVDNGGSTLSDKTFNSYTEGPPLGGEEQPENASLKTHGLLETAQQPIDQGTKNMPGWDISIVDISSNTQPTTPQRSAAQDGSFPQNPQSARSGQKRLVAKKPNPGADSPTPKRLVAKKPASLTLQTLPTGFMADSLTLPCRIPTPTRPTPPRNVDRVKNKNTTPEASPAKGNGNETIGSPVQDSLGGLPINPPMNLVMEKTRRMFNLFNGLPEDIEITLPEFGPALEEWWNRRHSDVKFFDMLGDAPRIVPLAQEIGRCTAVQAHTFTNDCCFEVGDVIAIYQYYNTEWWRGVNLRSRSGGLFPKDFVTLHPGSLPPTELPAMYPPCGNQGRDE